MVRHGYSLAIVCLAMIGCDAIPRPNPTDQSDLRNWDFSACLDDIDTCADLLLDNQEVILGGRNLIGFIIGGFAPSTKAESKDSTALAQIDLGSVFLPPAPLPNAPNQADIRNWDFSACLDDFESFGTCSDLLFDNAEIILGGRSLVETIVDSWKK